MDAVSNKNIAHRPMCPQLPLEIWEQIVGSIIDQRYLPRVWLNFRLVSKTLKQATQYVFKSIHLPNTNIDFGKFIRAADRDEPHIEGKLLFYFDGMSNNGNGDRAMFTANVKLHKPDCAGEELQVHNDHHRYVLEQYLVPYSRDKVHQVLSPSHIINVQHICLDSELPGLEVDIDKLQISVLWKPMLSLMFGEIEFVKWADKVQTLHDKDSSEATSLEQQKIAEKLQLMSCAFAYSECSDRVRNMRRRRIASKLRDKGVDASWETMRPDDTIYAWDTYEGSEDLQMDESWYWTLQYGRQEVGWARFYDGMGLHFCGLGEATEVGEEDLGIEVDWRRPDELEIWPYQ